MAQWSQGLPLGSTEHCFSFSKNSTSSETVGLFDAKPFLAWVGSNLRIWCDGFVVRPREGGQPGRLCCLRDQRLLNDRNRADWNCFCGPIDGRVGGGGDDETKLITRARDPPVTLNTIA